MKKMFLTFGLVVALASVAHAQDTKGLGRVKKIMGKEVYVMCEPLREYEIIERASTELGTALVGRSSIDKQIEATINKGLKRVEKGKLKEFDAVLTEDGDKLILIKFKD